MPSRPGIMMSTIAASNGSRARELESFLARGCQPHVVALAGQQRLENFAHDLFVVDDEDAVAGTGHGPFNRLTGRSVRLAGPLTAVCG